MPDCLDLKGEWNRILRGPPSDSLPGIRGGTPCLAYSQCTNTPPRDLPAARASRRGKCRKPPGRWYRRPSWDTFESRLTSSSFRDRGKLSSGPGGGAGCWEPETAGLQPSSTRQELDAASLLASLVSGPRLLGGTTWGKGSGTSLALALVLTPGC